MHTTTLTTSRRGPRVTTIPPTDEIPCHVYRGVTAHRRVRAFFATVSATLPATARWLVLTGSSHRGPDGAIAFATSWSTEFAIGMAT
jgi:hypothetical protein